MGSVLRDQTCLRWTYGTFANGINDIDAAAHCTGHRPLTGRARNTDDRHCGPEHCRVQATSDGYRLGMRVLVVDDEEDLALAVARGLRREGYAVDVAHSGEEALDKVWETPYDLICLDVTMPGMDGREVCRSIRDNPPNGEQPRVLMLTARDALEERVAGLDAGADDYLLKPFAFPELQARVRSLMRRDAATSGAVLQLGDVRLDTTRHQVFRGATEIGLTSKEFALLRYFMSSPGRVISQEELLDHVWDENADPFTNTVRVTVGTLRRKLTIDDLDPPIETVIGSGYRFLDPS